MALVPFLDHQSNAVHLKVGRWLVIEARGWGLVVAPIMLTLLLAAGVFWRLAS